MMYSTTNETFANNCAKLVYTGVVFIQAFFYHFTVTFLRVRGRRNKTIICSYVSSFVLLALLHGSDSLVVGVYDYYWGYQTRVGSQHILFILVFLLFYSLSYKELLIVYKNIQKKGTREYNKIKYVITAYLVGVFGTIDLVPNYGVEFYPFGFIFVVSWISLLAYAIVKHQLMDIRVVIKKTFSYSFVLLLLIVPCFAAVIITEKYLSQGFYYPVLGCLFVLVGFIFPRIKLRTERNLENILFKGVFDYRETLDNLSKKMATLQNLDELLSDATETIGKAIDTNSLGLYLLGDNGEYELKSSYGKYRGDRTNVDSSSTLVHYMRNSGEIIKNDGANKNINAYSASLRSQLDELGAYMSIPIKFERQLRGFIVISEKESAGDYSREELKVLSTMANQLAVAVENSLKFEEIKELSINLENKVAERTDELKEANEELKRLDNLKSEFFAKVSHELRTPLTNIVLPIQNILAEQGDRLHPENVKEKKVMLRNAYRLLKRINEILDIAKLDAGKMKIDASLRDVNSILEDIIVASSIGAKEMGIDLVFEPDDQLPKIYVDTEKIEKVFSNIVGNALKFTDRGGKVEVRTKELDDRIEVRVCDTGVGIAQKDLPYIFDRFHQADSSSSRKYEGTGLGLCLVKEFVELHYGSIEVRSELGKGTTFSVQLLQGRDHFARGEIKEEPQFETSDGLVERRWWERRKGERREMPEEDRETVGLLQVQLSDVIQGAGDSKAGGSGLAEGGEKEKSVLVVEDNRDLASNIARSLAGLYNVFVAYNGQQGLDRVRQRVPDLIISDVMMPEMDGHELCEKIKSDKRTQHIPIVLLTAKATLDDKIEGLKYGADQYLVKPFNPNELHAVVDSLLTKRELQAQLNKSNLELKKALHELEEAQVKLVHAARLESAGLLAAGVAHEIKNNMYCLRAGIEGINKRLTMVSQGKLDIKDTYSGVAKALETNKKAIEHSLFVVNSLLDFSRKDKEGKAFSDINKGIEDTLTIAMPVIKDKISVHKEYGEMNQVECRIEEINQVVINMIINAYQAIEEKGTVRIKTTQNGDTVVISIADDGPGIPKEHLPKIFTPFFSTKEGQNSGLGLSICYNIIKAHHGTVDIKSTPGQGTEFIIALPTKQPK